MPASASASSPRPGRRRCRHCEERSDEACLDGPLLARCGGRIFLGCVRLRACVRPVCAAKAAGQDGFRGREIQTIPATSKAVASCGLSPVADRTIPSISPSLARSARRARTSFPEPADLCPGGHDGHVAAGVALAARHQLPGDPRAILLASATAASLAGLRSMSASSQPDAGFFAAPRRHPPDHRGRPDHGAGCAASDRRRG